jgi:hypothetical protein
VVELEVVRRDVPRLLLLDLGDKGALPDPRLLPLAVRSVDLDALGEVQVCVPQGALLEARDHVARGLLAPALDLRLGLGRQVHHDDEVRYRAAVLAAGTGSAPLQGNARNVRARLHPAARDGLEGRDDVAGLLLVARLLVLVVRRLAGVATAHDGRILLSTNPSGMQGKAMQSDALLFANKSSLSFARRKSSPGELPLQWQEGGKILRNYYRPVRFVRRCAIGLPR